MTEDSPWRHFPEDDTRPVTLNPRRLAASPLHQLKHGCLQCKHCNIPMPEGWVSRWKYTTPQDWTRYETIEYIKEHNRHLPALCMYDAGWDLCRTDLYCGKFEYYKQVEPPSLAEEIFGSGWEVKAKEFEAANAILRVELKRARKISKSRLARLQKLEAK